MLKKVLICDDSAVPGRLMARRFMGMGIAAECCRSSLGKIAKVFSAGKYNGLIIFAYRADKKLIELVRTASEKGTAVFAGLYTPSAAAASLFIEAAQPLQDWTLPESFSRR